VDPFYGLHEISPPTSTSGLLYVLHRVNGLRLDWSAVGGNIGDSGCGRLTGINANMGRVLTDLQVF